MKRTMRGCALFASLLFLSCGTGGERTVSPITRMAREDPAQAAVLIGLDEDLPITNLAIAPGGKWLFGRPAIGSGYGGHFFRISLETGELTLIGGGIGQGPGELTGGPQLVHVWQDLVLVQDQTPDAIHVFSREGPFLFQIRMPQARLNCDFQFDFDNGRIITFMDNDRSTWSMDPNPTGPAVPGEPVFSEYILDSRHNAVRRDSWLDYSEWIRIKEMLLDGADLTETGRGVMSLWLSPGRMVIFSRSSNRFLLLDFDTRTVKTIREVLVTDPDQVPGKQPVYYHCGFREPKTGDILFIEPRVNPDDDTGRSVDYALHRFSCDGDYRGWSPVHTRHSGNEKLITPVEGVCNGSVVVIREIVELTGGIIASRLVRMPLPETLWSVRGDSTGNRN